MGSADAKQALGIALITIGLLTGGTTATLPWYGSLAVTAGVNMLSAGIQQDRFKDNKQKQGFRSTIRNTRAAQNIVFGEARVGGILACAHVNSDDNPNDTLHMVVMHSIAHPGGCDGITSVFMGNKEIADADIDAAGDVTNGEFEGLVNVRRMAGTVSQVYLPAVLDNFPGIGDNPRFTQIAYSYLRLKRPDTDKEFREHFPNGIPDYSVILRGQKCYDARLDPAQGGSGTQDSLNALTWTYSNNPALCLATYLIMGVEDGGAGWHPSVINWDTVAAAADICDELRTVPDGLGGSVVQNRYRCNAVLSTGDSLESNILTLLESMIGDLIWIGGKWEIHAGAYSVPSIDITDKDLRGAISGAPHELIEDVFNEVRVKYIDADSFYTATDAVIKQDATYVAQDNGFVSFREFDLLACTDEYQAQYIRNVWLRRSRQQDALMLPMNLRGLDIAPGMRINLTSELYGVTDKVYKVQRWLWNQEEGAPDIEVIEDEASVWLSALADYDERDIRSPTPSALFPVPAVPTNPSAESSADAVYVSWTSPAAHTYVGVDVYRAPDVSGSPGTFTSVRTVDGEYYTDRVTNGATYWYKMRTRNQYGKTSDFTTPVSSRGKQVSDGANVSAENLLRTDTEKKYCKSSGIEGTRIIQWMTTGKLEPAGLVVGDFVSFSMQVNTPAGTRGARMKVVFNTGSPGGVTLATSYINSPGGWTTVFLEAGEIPPDTAWMSVSAETDGSSGTVCVRKPMFHKGPVIAEYTPPIFGEPNVAGGSPNEETEPVSSGDGAPEAPWTETSGPGGDTSAPLPSYVQPMGRTILR